MVAMRQAGVGAAMKILPFHERQESRLKGIWHFKLVSVLAKEENAIINEFADDLTENFSKVSS